MNLVLSLSIYLSLWVSLTTGRPVRYMILQLPPPSPPGIQRASKITRCAAKHGCGVALELARRPAVRQARVRFPPGIPILPTLGSAGDAEETTAQERYLPDENEK
jgi:hypothetical protein